jgi:hypothetical protein
MKQKLTIWSIADLLPLNQTQASRICEKNSACFSVFLYGTKLNAISLTLNGGKIIGSNAVIEEDSDEEIED